MAWTTPRTWVFGELVTDGIMNVHVRDNLGDLDARVEVLYDRSLNTFVEHEEDFDVFAHGATATLLVGQSPWREIRVGAGSSAALQLPLAEHPGIERLTTDANNGDYSSILNWRLIKSNWDYSEFIVRPQTALTSVFGRAGLIVSTESATVGAVDSPNGIYFAYSGANANWRCITKSGGTPTNTDSGIALSTSNWYTLRIARSGASTAVFSINGAVVATVSTNVPADSADLSHVAFVETDTTAARHLDVDYVFARYALGQRHT